MLQVWVDSPAKAFADGDRHVVGGSLASLLMGVLQRRCILIIILVLVRVLILVERPQTRQILLELSRSQRRVLESGRRYFDAKFSAVDSYFDHEPIDIVSVVAGGVADDAIS